MSNLNQSYQWCIDKCNDPNVGYWQDYRNQKTVNGVTYYDCSSFIWYSLQAGGFNVASAYKTATGSAYTGNAITTPAHLHYGIGTIIPYLWRIDSAPLGWQKMFYLNPIDYLL